MTVDPSSLRSRRTILAGALGGAGAMLVTAIGRAAPVAAATGDPVTLGKGATATDNTADAATIVNSVAEPVLGGAASAANTGVKGTSSTGAGVWGQSGADPPGQTDQTQTGVYGYSDLSDPSDAGVWGDTVSGTGVVGTGDWGVYGTGAIGVVGYGDSASTAVYGFCGDLAVSDPIPFAPVGTAVVGVSGTGAGVGVRGHATAGSAVGVYASAQTTSQTALYVGGKLRLSRSGRVAFGSTSISKAVTISGVTTSSYVIATLQASVSGCYVRAAVPSTNKVTIYLSKAPGKTVYVGYVVIN